MVKMLTKFLCIALLLVNSMCAIAASGTSVFQILPLGTSGGELEDNLSSYLVRVLPDEPFVALDAGTLCSSIKQIPLEKLQALGIQNHSDKPINKETFFKTDIKAYLISHAHLDHISGLVLCSTIDSKKPIMGSASTILFLKENIFNWKIWPNFSDQGIAPTLALYHYSELNFGKSYSIPDTSLTVRAFPLSHGMGYQSTAFLLKAGNKYLLYLGDTGPDSIEKSDDLDIIWQIIAPLIKQHQLKVILIESSYTNSQLDKDLFGHLNPHWLLIELNQLAKKVDSKNPKSALKNLPILVTHIKQGLENQGNTKIVMQQLNTNNNLGVDFILPDKNKVINF